MKALTKYPQLSGIAIILLGLQLSAQINLNLKVFLEGPFNGTLMNTNLNSQNLIPLNQPYNVSPWNYSGTEQVSSIPNTSIIDWVLVELRETTGGASSATPDKTINRQAAFLKTDGSIVGTNGTSLITYSGTVTSNLYVIIYHRNHIGVMSSGPLTSGGGYTWDFTSQLSKAYLNGQKQIYSGVFGMISGDSDGSGIINQIDKDPFWTQNAGKQGYYGSDLNIDSQVSNPDKDDFWEVNYDFRSTVPRNLFECGDTLTDARNGESYNTVLIGTQCWMAENLNIGNMINSSSNQNNNTTIEKYCYNNIESNCNNYGGLYQWNEMMQYIPIEGAQGICPDGWYIPSDAEWCTLEQSVDPTINCNDTEWRGTNAGTKLKPGGSSGFNAQLGGLRDHPSGIFLAFNYSGYYWTSSQNATDGWFRIIANNNAKVFRSSESKNLGFAVRCILGETTQNLPPDPPSDPQPPDGAINQEINPVLSWTCTDPENDLMIYNVYFGTTNPPSLISSAQLENTFNTGKLEYTTTYYWKIVVHDDHSNSTDGSVWSFTTRAWQCGDTLPDIRDGKSYSTIQIGNQCWMGENLNIGTMIYGNNNQTQQTPEIIEKYCYNNSFVNCDVYGGLYQWNEMMQYATNLGAQGICPPVMDWHIPTDGDWADLINHVGGEDVAGGKLKETGFLHWNSPNLGAVDTYGFTALPSGIRFYYDNNFYAIGENNIFWTSNKFWNTYAWFRWLSYDSINVFHQGLNKNNGNSVRCVKNLVSNNLPPNYPANPFPSDCSLNQPLNIIISWSCSDPENDPLTYDVYFGNDFPLPLVSANQSSTNFDPPQIQYGNNYVWKIVAHDNQGNHTEGPVWIFKTLSSW